MGLTVHFLSTGSLRFWFKVLGLGFTWTWWFSFQQLGFRVYHVEGLESMNNTVCLLMEGSGYFTASGCSTLIRITSSVTNYGVPKTSITCLGLSR